METSPQLEFDLLPLIASLRPQFVTMKIVLLMLCLVGTVSCVNHRVTCEPQALMEREIVQRINQHRRSKGLVALREDPRITAQCREHCVRMAGQGKISHRGFSGRAFSLRNSFPGSVAAENVGMNYGLAHPAQRMSKGWISSAGHRDNIEGAYHFTGVGVVKTNEEKYFFSQIFLDQK